MSEISDKRPHILVVDDDAEIRSLLAKYLGQRGLLISVAEDGKAMLALLSEAVVDCIVLDVMMPGEDGHSLCRRVRQQSDVPIIMLTAVGEEFERIVALEIGADDYMSKPFNPRELYARIKAILRRVGRNGDAIKTSVFVAEQTLYHFANWCLDKEKRRLIAAQDDVEVMLTSGEFELLLALLERPNQVLSRDQLLNLTKNRDAAPFDRSIDIQVSRLRRRIEQDPKKPELIKTVRGGGYMLTADVSIQRKKAVS